MKGRATSAMLRCYLYSTTHGPLLVGLVNVKARWEVDLAEGRKVVWPRTLVTIDVHGAIPLEVGNGIYGRVNRYLLRLRKDVTEEGPTLR